MSKSRFAIAYPVWCQYGDGFREPEGDVIFYKTPKVGDELVLCDKEIWTIVKIEQDYNWPKVICEKKTETQTRKGTKMPSVNDLGESKYLAKEDVGNGLLVTIVGYDKVDVSRSDQPTTFKYIMKLKYASKENEECKPLVLNKTNGKRIAKIVHEQYGITRDYNEEGIPQNEDFDNWIGKEFVLWNNPDVEFGGEITGGIRVRAVQTQADRANPEYVGEDPPPPSDEDIPF